MNWWPFGKEETVTLDGPRALLADIEKRGKQYLADIDDGKFITPACKRTASDAACDEAAVADHTRLEAFRYLLEVPRGEFRLLAEPEIGRASCRERVWIGVSGGGGRRS